MISWQHFFQIIIGICIFILEFPQIERYVMGYM